jgi:hypothetical protein
MYFTRISRDLWRSVLSAVSHNRGRSWNVLLANTGHYCIFSAFLCLIARVLTVECPIEALAVLHVIQDVFVFCHLFANVCDN